MPLALLIDRLNRTTLLKYMQGSLKSSKPQNDHYGHIIWSKWTSVSLSEVKKITTNINAILNFKVAYSHFHYNTILD